MQANDVFQEEFFASLYDYVNPWSVSDDFYLKRAVENGGPVLDIGCGTGMLTCTLAAKGLTVTGVDPAEALLRVARTRPHADKVHWIQSEGQNLHLPRRFSFVYMTGHAFQQLLTDDDATRLLEVAADHLDSNGKFIFDTRNPAARAWDSWTPENSARTIHSPQHGKIRLFYDAHADVASGIVTIDEHYHFLDTGVGRAGRNQIRFIDQEHLLRLLANAGLSAAQWYGDWVGGPYLSTSNEIVTTGRSDSRRFSNEQR